MPEDVIILPPPGLRFNVPTEEGARVGLQLANLAACPTHEMCADCVFRPGSYPNQCEDTLAVVTECLINPKDGPFMCAHREDGSTPVCAGFVHARKKIFNK